MENYFSKYLENFKKVIDGISPKDVNTLFEQINKTIEAGNQILVFGNGGSAMNLSHFATDMVKGAGDALAKRVKVISLNDNAGLLTAIGNDFSYEDVFYKQLKTFANPGDLILTLSVSGNSPNLVKAFDWAKKNNIQSVAMVGGRKGELVNLATTTIVIDSLHYGYVEDAHMLICHMIAFGFIEGQKK